MSNKLKIDSNKLTIVGSVGEDVKPMKSELRLHPLLHKWIKENINGSKNTSINFLVNFAISQIDPLLLKNNLKEELKINEKAFKNWGKN